MSSLFSRLPPPKKTNSITGAAAATTAGSTGRPAADFLQAADRQSSLQRSKQEQQQQQQSTSLITTAAQSSAVVVVAGRGNALTHQVTSDGSVDYADVLRHATGSDRRIQSTHLDMIPLSQQIQTHGNKGSDEMTLVQSRPSEEAIDEATERTQAELDRIQDMRNMGKKGSTAAVGGGRQVPKYISYTPSANQLVQFNSGNSDDDGSEERLQQQQQRQSRQRTIKIVTAQVDPLDPSRLVQRKERHRNRSPPAPLMREQSHQTQSLTSAERKKWNIPGLVSEYKNKQGHLMSLDKLNANRNAQRQIRDAADAAADEEAVASGRGTAQERFLALGEALMEAEQDVRNEINEQQVLKMEEAQRKKNELEEQQRLLMEMAVKQQQQKQQQNNQTNTENENGNGNEDSEGYNERQRQRYQRDMELRHEISAEDSALRMARNEDRSIAERVALGLTQANSEKKSNHDGDEDLFDSRLYLRDKHSSSTTAGLGSNTRQSVEELIGNIARDVFRNRDIQQSATATANKRRSDDVDDAHYEQRSAFSGATGHNNTGVINFVRASNPDSFDEQQDAKRRRRFDDEA
ncbi:hypothetical protein GQ42DRAFT_156278 [Ramicandelaber brevisporus]|nr:hypothetical protein GQ42DRAFT_156278 [Ramicandelaber brevisporus]